MDYSQLSDFEINKRVAQLLGGFALTLAVIDEPPSGKIFDPGRFNPCNKAADAWPIIESNRIGVMPSEMKTKELWMSTSGRGSYSYHEKPLRAAMIVFLMMQDAKHA